jgi:hypothetical protein
LQREQVGKVTGVLTAQALAFVTFAIECFRQVTELDFFAIETLDECGALGFNFGAAPFVLVSQF